MQSMVKCCCCGRVANLEDVWSLWFPGVFNGEFELGDLCDTCHDAIGGLRDARDDEFPDNMRVTNMERFQERHRSFHSGKEWHGQELNTRPIRRLLNMMDDDAE